ncbi:S-adenosyl-L-methionine-dependent methyltransferase [Schizophyllum amplum]|uniref:S-adenosyl-L-methionine-dependent methyltransferase n=1 Tax=Schizophyllum amplum TaxID=97359 RepID=A0A550CNK8_9AGAR|nr:S-adenosyl-L-methionine-dependent methyltransferase [Auriculariopsis ampla]
MAPSYLRQLLAVLTEQVDKIEGLAEKNGLSQYPSLDELPNEKQNEFTTHQDVVQATYLASSAASQLAATLKPSGLLVYERASAHYMSSAMRVVSEACVPEILREAGPQGLHVKDIAAPTGTDVKVLSRALRCLCTNYVFKELSPDVFAHNRPSSFMDTQKPVDFVVKHAIEKKRSIDAHPHGIAAVHGDRYHDTNGILAVLDHNKAPVSTAFQTDEEIWKWIEHYPGHLKRLQMVMMGWSSLYPHKKNMSGFDWMSLPKDSLVIDVGTGIGSEAARIAKLGPQLKVVGQDRAQTINDVALPKWKTDPELKPMFDSGRVSLEAHNFFDNQPVRQSQSVAVFYLRYITHDWPLEENIKILKKLHAAASKDTLLILAEQAFSEVYLMDLTMAVLANGQERTIGEHKEMTEAAGWRIVKIHQTPGCCFGEIVCEKI